MTTHDTFQKSYWPKDGSYQFTNYSYYSRNDFGDIRKIGFVHAVYYPESGNLYNLVRKFKGLSTRDKFQYAPRIISEVPGDICLMKVKSTWNSTETICPSLPPCTTKRSSIGSIWEAEPYTKIPAHSSASSTQNDTKKPGPAECSAGPKRCVVKFSSGDGSCPGPGADR